MSIRYSTNWMGPISTDWYRDRGLTRRVTKVLDHDSTVSDKKAGDVIEYDMVTEYYCAGRIDCRGDGLGKYGDEISVPPMRGIDWSNFSQWLSSFESDAMQTLEQLVDQYQISNPKITWWKE